MMGAKSEEILNDMNRTLSSDSKDLVVPLLQRVHFKSRDGANKFSRNTHCLPAEPRENTHAGCTST